jgi:ATP-dependent DNA ligase
MSRAASQRQRSSSRFLARVLPGAKPARFPGFIEPTLATLGTKVPTGADYVHEVKLDGYRIQAHLNDGRVTLYTRTGLDWTKRFPTIADDIARLPAAKLVIDGEVVSPDADGRPNFGALQADLSVKLASHLLEDIKSGTCGTSSGSSAEVLTLCSNVGRRGCPRADLWSRD